MYSIILAIEPLAWHGTNTYAYICKDTVSKRRTETINEYTYINFYWVCGTKSNSNWNEVLSIFVCIVDFSLNKLKQITKSNIDFAPWVVASYNFGSGNVHFFASHIEKKINQNINHLSSVCVNFKFTSTIFTDGWTHGLNQTIFPIRCLVIAHENVNWMKQSSTR